MRASRSGSGESRDAFGGVVARVGPHALEDSGEAFGAVTSGNLPSDKSLQGNECRRIDTLFLAGAHNVTEIGELQALLPRSGVVAGIDDCRKFSQSAGHCAEEWGCAA